MLGAIVGARAGESRQPGQELGVHPRTSAQVALSLGQLWMQWSSGDSALSQT